MSTTIGQTRGIAEKMLRELITNTDATEIVGVITSHGGFEYRNIIKKLTDNNYQYLINADIFHVQSQKIKFVSGCMYEFPTIGSLIKFLKFAVEVEIDSVNYVQSEHAIQRVEDNISTLYSLGYHFDKPRVSKALIFLDC